MRVALCLSGHLREFEQAYGSIKEKLLDRYRPDVFIATWNELGYWTKHDDLAIKSSGKITPIQWNNLKQMYEPKKMTSEDLSDQKQHGFNQKADQIITSLRMAQRWGRKPNIVGMFYKIHQCDQLRQEYERENNFKYDLVIRSRPDLCLKQFSLQKSKAHSDERSLYVFQDGPLVSDLLFCGSSQVMSRVCNIYNDLYTICSKAKCLFDPHDILEHAIQFYQLKKELLFFEPFLWNTPHGSCKDFS
jgi:hypothetical protein